ncbi:TonB-dependent receptor [Halomonas borealis]|uniref:TonB-dependent receptor n=1 Tax=Halomonas borealis TaxID=2508710 RepID=UPI00109EF53C|nr:TonB-dependent receptor [Halomonas borealis]
MPRHPFFALMPLSATVLMGAQSAMAADHDHAAGHAHAHDAHGTHEPHESRASSPLALSAALTLEGIYQSRVSGAEAVPAGFAGGHDEAGGHAHDHAGHNHGLEDGFNLGHSELALRGETALFEGVAMVALDEDDIHLEEAYLATRALPQGLRLKAGRFLSAIGHVNGRHPHEWNFVERPLVNEYLFGDHGLREEGVQLSWSPSPRTTLGTEWLQGDGQRFSRFDEGGREEQDSGPRLVTVYAKQRAELGEGQTLHYGASAGINRQYARFDGHGDHAHSVEGDSWFAGLDARYQHRSGRHAGQGDWSLGAEYFYTERDLAEWVEHHHAWERHDDFTERQDGAYVEAIYGIAPQWELGLRGEALGLTNEIVHGHPSELEKADTSYRHSGQATWRFRDHAFLRAQVSHEDFAGEDESWVAMLQFNATFGGHAGHAH